MDDPRAQLEDSGWTPLGLLLEPGVLAALRDDAARLFLENTHLVEVWPNPEEQAASFAALMTNPRVLSAAAAVLGSPSACVVEQSLVGRSPGHHRHIPWHQDGPTWPAAYADAITVWIALDDAGADSGGLRYIPGSHQDPSTPDDPVTVRVDAGCGIAHHGRIWHATGPNRTQQWRRSCVLTVRPVKTPR